MTRKEQIQKILEQHTDDKGGRTSTPWIDPETNKTYATNGQVIIEAPADTFDALEATPLIGSLEYLVKLFDNAEAHFEHETANINEFFPLSDKDRAQLVFETTDCEKCDGRGETTCYHCDQTAECKNCKGAGRFTGRKTELIDLVSFQTLPAVRAVIKFDHFEGMLMAARDINNGFFTLIASAPHCIVFQVAELKFLIANVTRATDDGATLAEPILTLEKKTK